MGRIGFGIAAALLGIIGILAIQSVRAGPTAVDPEAAIRMLEDAEVLALLGQDFTVLTGLWSEAFMVNTPNNLVLSGRDVVLDDLRQDSTSYGGLERSIEHLHVDGKQVYVLGRETVQPILQGSLTGRAVERRFSHVWSQEDDGAWRLLMRHNSNMVEPVSPDKPRQKRRLSDPAHIVAGG